MSRLQIALTEDERDVADLVGDVVRSLKERSYQDTSESVAQRRKLLVDAGLWTLGVSEDFGGGGGSLRLRQIVLIELGRSWPAVAWSAVQAHAAAELLGTDPYGSEYLDAVHSGELSACVVDDRSPRVEVTEKGAVGVDRLDPAGERPLVLVTRSDDSVLLVSPGTGSYGPLIPRCGMVGSLTTSVRAEGSSVIESAVPVSDVRSALCLGAAAVAAGIATDSAERAASYAEARIQFGAALTALPTVRQSLLAQAANSRGAQLRALLSPAEPVAAAAALVDNCEAAIETASASLQMHGGYGYLAEYGIEQRLRDAISLRAATDAFNLNRAAAATYSRTGGGWVNHGSNRKGGHAS